MCINLPELCFLNIFSVSSYYTVLPTVIGFFLKQPYKCLFWPINQWPSIYISISAELVNRAR